MLDVQTIPLLTLPSVPFADRVGLPGCAAIYFVLNVHGAVLYIGCSVNLAARWRAHHRVAKLTDEGATRIAWLVMDDVALLAGVEAACIAYFEPPCNTSVGGYSKAPYTLGEPLVSIAARFPLSLVSRIDAHVEVMRRATPGLNIGRSDAFRILLVEGLDAVSRSAAVTDTVTDTTVTDPAHARRMIQEEMRAVMAHAENIIDAIDKAEHATGTAPDTVTDTVTATHGQPGGVSGAAHKVQGVTDTVTDTESVTDTVTVTGQAMEPFDTTKFYLGKLCPKGHDFEGTGQSLRRQHNMTCRECENESRREKRQAKRQQVPAD